MERAQPLEEVKSSRLKKVASQPLRKSVADPLAKHLLPPRLHLVVSQAANPLNKRGKRKSKPDSCLSNNNVRKKKSLNRSK